MLSHLNKILLSQFIEQFGLKLEESRCTVPVYINTHNRICTKNLYAFDWDEDMCICYERVYIACTMRICILGVSNENFLSGFSDVHTLELPKRFYNCYLHTY